MPPTYPRGMTRSPFTLAASVTQALPGAMVIATGSLTQGAAGRYDAAVALLEDGSKVAVRAPVDADAARELAAETLALRALTAGARSRLGFTVPTVLGEAGLGDARALVVDLLPGYQVDAAHIPAGDGIAPSIGRAIASIHALPTSIVRDAGLPSRTPDDSRAAVTALLDRAVATRRLPAALASRWRAAVEDDALWAFEQVVVHGNAGPGSFLFEDHESGPTVSGVLEWHDLAVGDPAVDLHWLASAPAAASDVFAGYALGSFRTPDTYLRSRARFYAELEFAKWLVHGQEVHRSDIVDDAVALLDSLVAGVLDHNQPPLTAPDEDLDVHAVEDMLDNVPLPIPAPNDTSFQTDAYDPDMLSLFEASERERASEAARDGDGATSRGLSDNDSNDGLPNDTAPYLGDSPAENASELSVATAAATVADEATATPAAADAEATTAPANFDDVSTAPVDISSWAEARDARVEPENETAMDAADLGPARSEASSPDASDESFAHEADRASRAAFRRWSKSD